MVIIIMAAGEALVFSGFLKLVLIQFSFQSYQLLFSHALDVRGENTPKRKFASTRYRTHNHQVMSQTRSPLSHQDRIANYRITEKIYQIPDLLVIRDRDYFYWGK